MNLIFYLVLFLGFFLPNNSNYYISLPGIQLEVREFAFLLLPMINLFCWSNSRVRLSDRRLRMLIGWFLFITFTTELFKHLYFEGAIGDAFKTIRIGLPLFSSLMLILSGIRADIEKVWRTLLWAILVSAILTLGSSIISLPIYSSLEGENILEASHGRLVNSNASFGIIGIYLLYADKYRWFNRGWLPKSTSMLGIVILILSFNRTYLALLVIALFYLSFTQFSIRKASRIVAIPILAIGLFWLSYSNSEQIQKQVDKRIFDIVIGSSDLVESVYENNREIIFQGVAERIEESYWVFGLVFDKPIFYWSRKTGPDAMTTTDTSIVNILLRYGVLPLTLFCLIVIRFFRISQDGLLPFSLLFFVIASFNLDTLMRHNSIFFIAIVFMLSMYSRKKI